MMHFVQSRDITQRLNETGVLKMALTSGFFVTLLIACGLPMLFSIEKLSAAQGDPSIPEQEIAHLLNFIETSGCVFIRNNKKYDGMRARDHLNSKYEYLKKREHDISAEQFIQYAASQSSLSKKPYSVQCGSADPIHSEQWLSRELSQFRQNR